ncbi:hypothetical protein AAW51_1646 [Caldimonas brevitalea]|uniref:Mercuric ion transport protein n=1 Tax=Caldimonas brevitalea TaxID=413882 RepID=A0A0G3BGA6_9BURK|nr:hypothetical protein AAW51_1646 [Caldimonas brevitalea]
MTLLGLGAACAACCAIPLALPLLGGLAMSGGLGLWAGWPLAVGAAVLTVALASGWYLLRRRRACKAEPADQERLGCGSVTTGTSNSPGGSVCGCASTRSVG